MQTHKVILKLYIDIEADSRTDAIDEACELGKALKIQHLQIAAYKVAAAE